MWWLLVCSLSSQGEPVDCSSVFNKPMTSYYECYYYRDNLQSFKESTTVCIKTEQGGK